MASTTSRIDKYLGLLHHDYLTLCASSCYHTQCMSSGVPFTSYIDYVRFTPVGQGGGSQ